MGTGSTVVVEDLHKTYLDGTEAVRGLWFDVGEGEIFGVLGPNGACKSTTLGVLTTVVQPSRGRAYVAGHDVSRDAVALLQVLGTDSRYADAVATGALDDPAIPDKIRALAQLASDITRHAYRITDDQISEVRAHGWTEAQLLEAVWVARIFNAIVRLADTLGLHRLGQLDTAGTA